jgi:hypothetical protein
MNSRRRHEPTSLPTIVATSFSESFYAAAADGGPIAMNPHHALNLRISLAPLNTFTPGKLLLKP